MKYRRKNGSPRHIARAAGRVAGEDMLRAEIGFWREMLESCDCNVPAENIERMQQALALAERRFLQHQVDNRGTSVSWAGPAGTSFRGTGAIH